MGRKESNQTNKQTNIVKTHEEVNIYDTVSEHGRGQLYFYYLWTVLHSCRAYATKRVAVYDMQAHITVV